MTPSADNDTPATAGEAPAAGAARPDGAGVPADDGDGDGEDGAPVRAGRSGRTLGILLGLAAAVGLVVMAAAGFTPALYLLVLAVVGTGLVVIGTRLR